MQIVSACLIGCKCRYDQGACLDETIENLLKEGKAIPVCPEQMGGLPTPRPPAEIIGGDGFDVWEGRAKVVDNTGRDVTEEFKSGALQGAATRPDGRSSVGNPEGKQSILRQFKRVRWYVYRTEKSRRRGNSSTAYKKRD